MFYISSLYSSNKGGHKPVFECLQGTAAGQSEVFDYSGKKAATPVAGSKTGATPKSPAADLGVGPRQQQRKPQTKGKKKGKRF